ncbi:hypothetical protein [uncultured Ruegeria sp.]|uniref:hypothetical protein n=1 Tax=uncultured Ruegeria sp. TaxID=259304 RepID=UPI002602E017|nr:hypothetical protein [uncultured Ruegeria sp.]
MNKLVTFATLTALMLSTPASAAFARFGYQTVELTNSDFEVIPRGRTDVDGYWCAAADFARRDLDAEWQQRIYVTRGYGPSEATGRKSAVQFSLTAPEGFPQRTSKIVVGDFRPGYSMSLQGANGRCGVKPFSD